MSLTFEQRTSIISAWVTQYLARKSMPKRLTTNEATIAESRSMVRAINRHTHTDANRQQLDEWLLRLGDDLDLQDVPTWPSIGDVVKTYKRLLPSMKPIALTPTPEERTESAGSKLAQDWARSQAAVPHFEAGSHVNALQWIRRNNRLPNSGESEAIMRSAHQIGDFIREISDGNTSKIMRVGMLLAAKGMLAKRRSAYEAGRRIHHSLPEFPQWADDTSSALVAEYEAQSGKSYDDERRRAAVVDANMPVGIEREDRA